MDKPQSRHSARHTPKRPGPRFGRLRIKKPTSLRGKALRWLAGFLLLMALFTVLSRAADELTIPRVTLAEAQRRTIDRKISAYGKVGELSALAVTTEPGIRVAGVAVKPGGRVEMGAPLFTLERADLEEKLAEAQEELEKMDMDLEDQAGREALDAQNRALTQSRASQDYTTAQNTTGREVERAAKALEKAKAALASYTPPPAVDLAPLERALEEKEAALTSAREELADLEREVQAAVESARQEALEQELDPDAAQIAVEEAYRPQLDSAAQRVTDAEQERTAAQEALAQAQAQPSGMDDRQALEQAVELAQESYDRAVESRDASLRMAQRAVEDAERPTAPDSSAEKAKMARDHQAELVERLRALLAADGVVRAPSTGAVTGVSVETGSPTPAGTAVLLASGSGGTVFTAQISADQEKYISPGDDATLKPGRDKEDITGLTVESVSKSAGDPTLLDVTVRLPEGTLEIGATAEMVTVRKSVEYPVCVPLSALHEENGGYYLLVPRTVQTILGEELTASRLSVTIIEKNTTYAALENNSLFSGQQFLNGSNKPVQAGDRIRREIS